MSSRISRLRYVRPLPLALLPLPRGFPPSSTLVLTPSQDLWLPYFNVTTDITASAMRVHKDGGCHPAKPCYNLVGRLCGDGL